MGYDDKTQTQCREEEFSKEGEMASLHTMPLWARGLISVNTASVGKRLYLMTLFEVIPDCL